ncbi:hypothetical protein NMY22_g13778 [Coprinellus aureogranulatus]|nr:hypothetical protein NMY22_g13778 [Coprinellus aureogranulatus]
MDSRLPVPVGDAAKGVVPICCPDLLSRFGNADTRRSVLRPQASASISGSPCHFAHFRLPLNAGGGNVDPKLCSASAYALLVAAGKTVCPPLELRSNASSPPSPVLTDRCLPVVAQAKPWGSRLTNTNMTTYSPPQAVRALRIQRMTEFVVEAQHLHHSSERDGAPCIYHFDAESQSLEKWAWPCLSNDRASPVPPDELEQHGREYAFRTPCCPCAFMNGVPYTPTKISLLERIRCRMCHWHVQQRISNDGSKTDIPPIRETEPD